MKGIPEQAEVPPVAQAPAARQAVNPPAQAPQPVASSGPNANPLDLFPQVRYVWPVILYSFLPKLRVHFDFSIFLRNAIISN